MLDGLGIHQAAQSPCQEGKENLLRTPSEGSGRRTGEEIVQSVEKALADGAEKERETLHIKCRHNSPQNPPLVCVETCKPSTCATLYHHTPHRSQCRLHPSPLIPVSVPMRCAR